MTTESEKLVSSVQQQYAAVARSGLSNESTAVRQVAQAFGYSPSELAGLPAESNMGLSCGNPVAMAGLSLGEVVVDLGCGGGLDVLLAARQVGPTGRSIGIDMTEEMLARARTAAAKAELSNVQFFHSTIDSLPLADDSVDCVISNCVINLVPDKDAAFREILRVLKPGGRVAISDIALHQPLPEDVRGSIEAYVGCIAGAILIDDYRQRLATAGFQAIVVSDTGADLNAYAQVGLTGQSACCAPADSVALGCCQTPAQLDGSLHGQLAEVLNRFDANAYAASVRVQALKPQSAQQSAPQSN